MKQILVIGDTHIPDRAENVPRIIRDYLERGKPWIIVVFTGDVTGEPVLNWIKSLGKELYIVRGNMDYLPLPRTQVFDFEGFKIGIHHGDGFYPRGDTGKLSSIASKLEVNILISGHTHSDFIKIGTTGKELLLNPGSLTGVWGGAGGSFTPSFMVLEIIGKMILIRTLKLTGGNLIEKTTTAKFIDGRWILE
ncbi:MAG: YfcE family phosphodiesterase [Desulfurococcaceae archaeon]